MANDVFNRFSIHCHPYAVIRVRSELEVFFTQLQTNVFVGQNTRWNPDFEEPLKFVSRWGPDHEFHDQLTARFAQVDSSVRISNSYYEELYQFAGVRLAGVVSTAVQSINKDGVPEIPEVITPLGEDRAQEELDHAVLLLQDSCLKFPEEAWVVKFLTEPVELDLGDYANIFATIR